MKIILFSISLLLILNVSLGLIKTSSSESKSKATTKHATGFKSQKKVEKTEKFKANSTKKSGKTLELEMLKRFEGLAKKSKNLLSTSEEKSLAKLIDTLKTDPEPETEKTEEEPIVYVKKKEDIEAEKAQYQAAEDIYGENPHGRDIYEEIVEGEMFVKVTHLKKEDLSQEIKKYNVRCNSHNLYLTAEDDSYRGVMAAIPLANLISDRDNPISGKCCQKVENVVKPDFKVPKGMALFCFKVHSQSQIWDMCSASHEEADQWRSKIVTQIIMSELHRRGIYDEKPFMVAQQSQCEVVSEWSWQGQKDWPCFCSSGLSQSPIHIQTKTTQPMRKTKLVWQYKQASAVVKEFDSHEQVISGDFGIIMHAELNNRKKFRATKIKFKFPSEHKLDGHVKSGEMQVYHVDDEGNRAIMSIFLEKYDEVSDNKFINDLHPDNVWHLNPGETKCIDSQPNLMEFFATYNGDTPTPIIDKSFFFYQGSETTPPCMEPVTYFVMKIPVKIPSDQLNKLRESMNVLSGSMNVRKLQKVGDRHVYFHDESADSCIFEEPIEVQEEVEKEQVKVKEKEIEKDTKWLKANSNLTFYGISEGFDKLPFDKSIDLGNGIVLEQVNQDEIPEDEKTTIMKKLKKAKTSQPPEEAAEEAAAEEAEAIAEEQAEK